ncbi:MAG: 50S ribosomal protein L15 [Candidatus Marinimicrobia bacterium]|jgi:large subunit ribosomal protein L15|nr:50S ribosomal protein L15 [Candidatus Neomarinimicrobiota bacterium]MBT3496680.1 50S ribosomal protein L15 [Candidatus Neomarinimicrobiota bacterium]MBT3692984.1 50S ribosomal protein L15 [Candidatus Neomarinimicrobiota bacterium]MBT3731947.1 50S ribosomal protein L15 [Candidatus Neomarinimicrobiota bacterium]MBT4144434.1 50S ribosomal protein L15 [Candidatus Neomarinimicrobiota bacterium]
MKIEDLSPVSGSVKNTKRRGRGPGTGLGKTGGRGHKGAGARSGFKRRAWFEGGQMALARRLPKRGFSNHLFKKSFQIVNVEDLNKLTIDVIDATVMVDSGLVKSALKPIKILGNGEIDKKLQVTASAFSASAKEKIEKAGGSTTEQ